MKKKWQQWESKTAKDFAGKLTPSSGNKWHSPGDVKNELFLIDSKTTVKKSYSISIETWDKLCEEAAFSDRIPMLSLQLGEFELVVLSKADFIRQTKKEG
jgi:hypothetical protein